MEQEKEEDQHEADQDNQTTEVTDRIPIKSALSILIVHEIPP
jgi:hypothetical protein